MLIKLKASFKLLILATIGVFLFDTAVLWASAQDPTVVGVSSRRLIDVPDLADQSKMLSFKFLTYPREAFSPDKYTLVVLPGGPGGAGSENYLEVLTSNAQLVFIDPRGTGLNLDLAKVNPELLSSEKTAEDIMKVIRTLGLSNYSVWGESYGTVVATILVHKLEANKDISRPRSLVLEGTFNKAVQLSDNFLWVDYDRRIKDFYSQLPQESFDLLKELRRLQLNGNLLNQQIEDLFNVAQRESRDKRFETFNFEIKALIGEFETGVPEYREAVGVDPAELFDSNPRLRAFYYNEWIMCKELMIASTREDLKKWSGTSAYGSLPIPCMPVMNNPNVYKSANYQITQTPIVYLQGFNDFQTPFPEALDHKNAQLSLSDDSSFLLIMGGNHAVFTNEFAACRESFTADLSANAYGLDRTRQCALDQNVTIKDY